MHCGNELIVKKATTDFVIRIMKRNYVARIPTVFYRILLTEQLFFRLRNNMLDLYKML